MDKIFRDELGKYVHFCFVIVDDSHYGRLFGRMEVAHVNETQLYGQHCQVCTCTALGEFLFCFFPLWELVEVAYTEAFSLSECESQPNAVPALMSGLCPTLASCG